MSASVRNGAKKNSYAKYEADMMNGSQDMCVKYRQTFVELVGRWRGGGITEGGQELLVEWAWRWMSTNGEEEKHVWFLRNPTWSFEVNRGLWNTSQLTAQEVVRWGWRAEEWRDGVSNTVAVGSLEAVLGWRWHQVSQKTAIYVPIQLCSHQQRCSSSCTSISAVHCPCRNYA